VRFRWKGAEVRQSARTTSKAVAEQMLARLLAEHRRRDLDGRPRRTLHEAIERFRAEYMPMLKPRTRSRYETSFRMMAPALGGLHLDGITRARLADFASERLRAGLTGATVRRDLNTLSGVMACCVAWDWIDENPVRRFSRRHLREAAPRTAYPSAEQVERLAAHASPMAGRMIRLLAATGMRQEEVCSLEWTQVSLARREVVLAKTKTSSPRVVPLSEAALAVLAGTPRHPTSPFVFWHGEGVRYTRFANSFVLIARRAGVPFRCHDLRHRFASEFLMATGDIAALQRILGHKTVSMTMRYSHLATRHLHRAMAEFDRSGAPQDEGRAHAEAGTSDRHPRPDGRGSEDGIG
jgi:integrase